MSDHNQERPTGMSPRLAGTIEFTIIGLCIFALFSIFQPFSLALFSVGCVLVVVGALAFNLVPLAIPGVPLRTVVTGGIVVLIILVVVVALAILAAWLYGVYFVKPIGT